MIVARYILRKFDMQILQICAPHQSDVATLPWEIQKNHFNSIIHTYFSLFMLSQKKTNCNPLAHPAENVTTLTCEWVVVGGSERTGCDVWQLECQASSVTASVQNDHFLR